MAVFEHQAKILIAAISKRNIYLYMLRWAEHLRAAGAGGKCWPGAKTSDDQEFRFISTGPNQWQFQDTSKFIPNQHFHLFLDAREIMLLIAHIGLTNRVRGHRLKFQ